ncbi:phosphatidic acid phosphatase type 2/haloperoxidase [Haematococcus lacustris]
MPRPVPVTVVLLLTALASHRGCHAALGPSVVVDWLNQLQSYERTYTFQIVGRYFGLLGLAMGEAARASRALPDQQSVNSSAVVAVAAHTLLTTWLPFTVRSNDQLIARQLRGISPPALLQARALGEAAANKVSAARIGDGFASWAPFIPAAPNISDSIGRYQFTPGQIHAQYPQLGDTLPLVLSREEVTQIVEPLIQAFNTTYRFSPDYYADLQYTAAWGGRNSSLRLPQDEETVQFWVDGAGTASIAGHWLNISYAVLPANYSVEQQAAFFARIGAAMADTGLACYKIKYSALAWRPVTAIQQGDNSSRLAADPSWQPFINTPPHPAYPAGHVCLSAAAYQVLADALGTEAVSVSIGSEGLPGRPPRTYTSLRAVAEEVGRSRIMAGVHVKRECEDALLLGQKVARAVQQRLAT